MTGFLSIIQPVKYGRLWTKSQKKTSKISSHFSRPLYFMRPSILFAVVHYVLALMALSMLANAEMQTSQEIVMTSKSLLSKQIRQILEERNVPLNKMKLACIV